MKPFSTRILLLTACFILMSSLLHAKPKRSFYQLTVYQYTTVAQETLLNNYLKNALLPALHRSGFTNIGVFKSLTNDTAAIKMLYVFLTIKSLEDQSAIAEKLNGDIEYQSAGSEYINAPYTAAPYSRMEVMILRLFQWHHRYRYPNLNRQRMKEYMSCAVTKVQQRRYLPIK
jgi:hypothetical protein